MMFLFKFLFSGNCHTSPKLFECLFLFLCQVIENRIYFFQFQNIPE